MLFCFAHLFSVWAWQPFSGNIHFQEVGVCLSGMTCRLGLNECAEFACGQCLSVLQGEGSYRGGGVSHREFFTRENFAPGLFRTAACKSCGKFRTLPEWYCLLPSSSCFALPNSSGFQDCFGNFQELTGLHSLLSGGSCMIWISIPCPKVQGNPALAPLSALGHNKHQFPRELGFLDP